VEVWLFVYLSVHRAVIFVIEQLSCFISLLVSEQNLKGLYIEKNVHSLANVVYAKALKQQKLK